MACPALHALGCTHALLDTLAAAGLLACGGTPLRFSFLRPFPLFFSSLLSFSFFSLSASVSLSFFSLLRSLLFAFLRLLPFSLFSCASLCPHRVQCDASRRRRGGQVRLGGLEEGAGLLPGLHNPPRRGRCRGMTSVASRAHSPELSRPAQGHHAGCTRNILSSRSPGR